MRRHHSGSPYPRSLPVRRAIHRRVLYIYFEGAAHVWAVQVARTSFPLSPNHPSRCGTATIALSPRNRTFSETRFLLGFSISGGGIATRRSRRRRRHSSPLVAMSGREGVLDESLGTSEPGSHVVAPSRSCCRWRLFFIITGSVCAAGGAFVALLLISFSEP